MKKTTQNKTKLNSKSKYEGMALFDIEKDLLKVSEVKSSKLDLGLLDKEYKALASKKYTNFSKETSEFLYTAFLQNYLNHDDKAKCKIEDVVGNISFENLKPYLPKECKNFSDAYNYYIKKFDFLKLYKAVHNIVLPQEYDDSNADEISQDVPFEPNRFEDLCGFFSSIKRPCYVSCCFSALFARTYLVVTDEEYKHKRGYDADYTYKINCKVGDVVSSIEHFIDRTFNANSTQFGEDLLDEFSDLIVGGLHKNLTVYNKVAQREEMVSSSVIYGYPGDVAFKIGQAFYNGTDLPLDKFNARDWFAYGAAVGDIKCALAYMLHFMDVNFEDCGVANDNAAFMHGLLFNNFVSSVHRTYRNSKALLFGFIPNDSENPKLLEESIFNLINFYIEYHNHGIDAENKCNEIKCEWANKHGVPIIACTDAHYFKREDTDAHKVLLCIQYSKGGNNRWLDDPSFDGFPGDRYWLLEEDELIRRYPAEYIKNTRLLTQKCDGNIIEFGDIRPPQFKIPEDFIRRVKNGDI